MPPQSQPNQQQPTQPIQAPQQPISPTPSPNTELLSKKIHNAGQSVFLLGCLLAFIGIVASLALGSLEADKRVKTAAYLLMFVTASIYWIIAGIQIKRNTGNPQSALAAIRTALIVSVVVSVISIVVTFLGGKLGAGDFSIVLAIYLFVAQSRIKKLAS